VELASPFAHAPRDVQPTALGGAAEAKFVDEELYHA